MSADRMPARPKQRMVHVSHALRIQVQLQEPDRASAFPFEMGRTDSRLTPTDRTGYCETVFGPLCESAPRRSQGVQRPCTFPNKAKGSPHWFRSFGLWPRLCDRLSYARTSTPRLVAPIHQVAIPMK